MAISETTQDSHIHRSTLFKVPDPENQKKLVDLYRNLERENSKDGKPYIIKVNAGLAKDDPRSKGYTVVTHCEFASLDDMKYYDQECPAHLAIKKAAPGLGLTEPPLAVYF
ncbi:hypothetical protein B0T17DRAFT_614473 [Bombardia bombarda]|uniref:Stress-response A/B barrel domain-containing protein n=1 Tax=Bombardia bombarda TaxID=252184 RepID=A0AA39X764_9PEZI|nr:hypothetical protein B0T17DRAFT_614473 [Bombardia bombarda]